GEHGRAGGTEMQFHIMTIRACKFRGDIPRKRQSTSFAKRRFDHLRLLPAGTANKPFSRGRVFMTADLTDLRIDESEGGIKPRFKELNAGNHQCHSRFGPTGGAAGPIMPAPIWPSPATRQPVFPCPKSCPPRPSPSWLRHTP